MPPRQIQITVAYEVDEDGPVADISFRGEHWATVRGVQGKQIVDIYGRESAADDFPLQLAIDSLKAAGAQLDLLDQSDGS